MVAITARGLLSKPTTLETADVAVLNANADNISLYAAGDFLCTSATHPSAPWLGMRIYETDTFVSLIWSIGGWIGLNLKTYTAALDGTYIRQPLSIITGYAEIITDGGGVAGITFPLSGFASGLLSVTSDLMGAVGISDPTPHFKIDYGPRCSNVYYRPLKTGFHIRVYTGTTPATGGTFGVSYTAMGWD